MKLLGAAAMLVAVSFGSARGAEGIREEVRRPAAAQLTKAPVLLQFIEAAYPPEARRQGIAGEVNTRVSIDAQGRVTAVDVLETPDASLAAAAVEAIRRFRFSPAEVDHKPAAVRIRYVYHFTLRPEESPASQRTSAPTSQPTSRPTSRPTAAPAPAAPSVAKAPRYVTVVSGDRGYPSVSQVTLGKRQLFTVPGTFGDPIRVVQNLPGLARAPYVGGELLIRGSAARDSGTYLEGVRIPLLYHFLGGPSVLNPEFLQKIDYYPGNADVRYNGLIGGVVNVRSRDTCTRELHGAVDLSLLAASVFLNVPISDRISVAAAVRRSYIDAILPAILESSDSNTQTLIPVYYDYQLRVDTRLSGGDRLWLMAFGAHDDLEQHATDEDFDLDLNQKLSFHRLVAHWQHRFAGGKGVSRLQPHLGFNLSREEIGSTSTDLRGWIFGLREDLEYRVSRRLRLRGGVDLHIDRAAFEGHVPIPAPYRNPASAGGESAEVGDTGEAEAVKIRGVQGNVGLYTGVVIGLTKRLQLAPGLRTDIFFYPEDNVRVWLDPRLTMRWRVTDKTVLKGGAGLYSQVPAAAPSTEVFGNPDLGLEHAAQFALGVERELFWPELTLDTQVYFNYRFDNAIPTREVQVEGESVQPLRFASAGDGYSTGIEVMLKHEVTRHFYGWLSYTLSWARQRPEVGEDLAWFAFDQRHLLTAVASLRFGSGWEAGLRFRLASGSPQTPVLGGIFDADGGFYRQLTGKRGSLSRPLFHQLDLRLEKTWFFRAWRLSAYVDVQNVYNAKNPEATAYDYRFRQSAPVRGLPILPTLGIKGSF